MNSSNGLASNRVQLGGRDQVTDFPSKNRGLAAETINGRLAAVRRLAYEAADTGLLSRELAAGIQLVKAVKKLSVKLGKWPTAEEARLFWQAPDGSTLKGKRDRAIVAVLLGCACAGRSWLIKQSQRC
jgi:site-specific recombinase XerC